MNVLGITMARGGSVTVPRKNVRPILGKPLIVYTIEVALQSTELTNYVVASDDHETLTIALDNGADVVKTPAEIADGSHMMETLLHAIDCAEERWDIEYDAIADIRCTNPLKTVSDIDGAIKTLVATGVECVAGISPSQHPSRIKTVEYDDGGIPRLKDVWPEPSAYRQDLVPETFVRNGSIYVATVAHLRSGKYFVGVDVVPWMMPKMRSVNIDDWIDFWAAAGVLEYMNG
jgi:CMP-N-acetylneuraminic acid synthetase